MDDELRILQSGPFLHTNKTESVFPFEPEEY